MTDKELQEREELLEDILDALEDGEYEEVEDLADEAIEAFPDEAFGYYYLGEALFFQSEIEAAIEHYQEAVNRAAYNSDYQARLALMYAKLNEEEKAIQLYKSVIELNRNHIDSLVALGVYALNNENYVEAVHYLTRAIKVDANYTQAYKVRSLANLRMGAKEEALSDIEKAIELEPNIDSLWKQKIELLILLGQNDDVETTYQAWFQLRPSDTTLYANYGAYLHGQKKLAEADAAYTKAIELEKYGEYAAFDVIMKRAWLRLEQESLEAATEDFKKLIDFDAKVTDSYAGMAAVRLKQGNKEGALTYLDLGISMSGADQWMLYAKKGAIYVEQQNWEAAAEAFNNLVETDIEYIMAEGYFCLGGMYLQKGDLELAYKAWRNAEDCFHLEASDCIEEHCQKFVAQELKEKELELLSSMKDDFEANRASEGLQPAFGHYWKVDLKLTVGKNKLLQELSKDILSKFTEVFEQICIAIEPEGFLLLNPGHSHIRMLYSIKSEKNGVVNISGIPLDGASHQAFELRSKSGYLILRGFGQKDADVDIIMQSVALNKLSSAAQNALKKLNKAGELTYMGNDFISKF